MGRLPIDNVKQYHQGLEFEEFHQTQTQTQTEGTINVVVDYDHQEKIGSSNQVPSCKDIDKTQAFPPPPRHDDHQEPQAFPPHQDETTRAFPPPPNHDHQDEPHEFPPTPEEPSAPPSAQLPIPQPPRVTIDISPFIQLNNTQFPTQAWKTHLFDCMRDPKNAIITAFFPCVTFGQIAEILDSGRTSCGTSGMYYMLIGCCIAMPCLMSCSYRGKIRSRLGLIESPLPDCIVHCFCEWCALCQEYRELQERGFDPSIGWLGNLAQYQRQQLVMTTAPMQQRMM